MLSVDFKSIFQSSVRFILTAMVCCLMFVANVFPAYAVTSSSTDKEAELDNIQNRTEQVGGSKPMNLEETVNANKGGLNEVQGSADSEKMVKPEETSATSPIEQAKNFFNELGK